MRAVAVLAALGGAFVEVAAQLSSTVTRVGSCPALAASSSTK